MKRKSEQTTRLAFSETAVASDAFEARLIPGEEAGEWRDRLDTILRLRGAAETLRDLGEVMWEWFEPFLARGRTLEAVKGGGK